MDGVPEGAVVITTADMYRMLVELNGNVGEIKGSIGALNSTVKAVDDHEVRIRSLERWKYGLAAAVLAGGGGSVAAFTQAVGH